VELLFVVLLSFAIGLAVRYLLPGRDSYGSMLVPSISAAAGTIIWVILTWVGLKFDGGWIWVASLLGGGVIGLVFALVIPRTRRTADDELMKQLSTPSRTA